MTQFFRFERHAAHRLEVQEALLSGDDANMMDVIHGDEESFRHREIADPSLVLEPRRDVSFNRGSARAREGKLRPARSSGRLYRRHPLI